MLLHNQQFKSVPPLSFISHKDLKNPVKSPFLVSWRSFGGITDAFAQPTI